MTLSGYQSENSERKESGRYWNDMCWWAKTGKEMRGDKEKVLFWVPFTSVWTLVDRIYTTSEREYRGEKNQVLERMERRKKRRIESMKRGSLIHSILSLSLSLSSSSFFSSFRDFSRANRRESGSKNERIYILFFLQKDFYPLSLTLLLIPLLWMPWMPFSLPWKKVAFSFRSSFKIKSRHTHIYKTYFSDLVFENRLDMIATGINKIWTREKMFIRTESNRRTESNGLRQFDSNFEFRSSACRRCIVSPE